MNALFRNTTIGTVLRFLTRNRCLQFPSDEANRINIQPTRRQARESHNSNGLEVQQIVLDWWEETLLQFPHADSARKGLGRRSAEPTELDDIEESLCGDYNLSLHLCRVLWFLDICSRGDLGLQILLSKLRRGLIQNRKVENHWHASNTNASLGLALYVLGYGPRPLLFSPLSEIPQIGRNPVYSITTAIFLVLSVLAVVVNNFTGFMVVRFLQGFFGSPCLATGAASLGDMFPVVKIPYALAAWSGSMYFGPALGPVMSGFAVMARGWRWSMLELLWMAAFIFVIIIVFLSETSSPVLLHQKAKRIQHSTGRLDIVANGVTLTKDLKAARIAKLALIKPFEITLKDPAIAFTNFYTALTYGIYYSFFEAFALVYGPIYGFNIGEEGATFLCILIAALLGIVAYCSFYRCFEEPQIRKAGTFRKQETFLRPGLAGVFGVTGGLFLFGWAAKPSIPWPIPTLGIVMYCGSSFVVGLGLFIYLPLSYPQYSASLFAANDVLRSAFAAGAILFGRPLYANIGIDRGSTLLGGLSVLGIAGLWYLYVFGEALRKRSKFTAV